MIACDHYDNTIPGYHECLLVEPSVLLKRKCGWADNCWAFVLSIQNGPHGPLRICNVKDMSITIAGELLPVKIDTGQLSWEMSLKDWPTHAMFLKDWPTHAAVAHWTIVPCGAAP
jgi:hypothetical protein